MTVQTRVLVSADAGPLRAALSLASWPAPVLVSLEDTRVGDILVLCASAATVLLRHLEAFADGADAPAVPVAISGWAVLRGYYPAILHLAQKGGALNLDRGAARLAAGLLRRLLAEARTRPLGEMIADREDQGR